MRVFTRAGTPPVRPSRGRKRGNFENKRYPRKTDPRRNRATATVSLRREIICFRVPLPPLAAPRRRLRLLLAFYCRQRHIAYVSTRTLLRVPFRIAPEYSPPPPPPRKERRSEMPETMAIKFSERPARSGPSPILPPPLPPRQFYGHESERVSRLPVTGQVGKSALRALTPLFSSSLLVAASVAATIGLGACGNSDFRQGVLGFGLFERITFLLGVCPAFL